MTALHAARLCPYCDGVLVRRDGESERVWGLRRFCGRVCKQKLAHQLHKARHRVVAASAPITADFRPHEIAPRDGGPMPRIDRALPLARSLAGSSADWA